MSFLDFNGLTRFKQKLDAIFAKIDGSYASMTVGNAEQLVSTVGIEDKVPYNFRTSGGTADIGDRERVDAIVGGTVMWNQLAALTSNSWTKTNVSVAIDGNTIKTTVTSASSIAKYARKSLTTGHVYYAYLTAKYGTSDAWAGFKSSNFTTRKKIVSASQEAPTVSGGCVYKAQSGDSFAIGAYYNAAANGTYQEFENVVLIDLTMLFGSTVAEYVNTIETSNNGDGAAFVHKLFPNTYYVYNAGELMSVKTSEHKMIGFNAYDNSTGKAKVIGGVVYQITGTYTGLTLNGSTITPDASGYFTPSESGEISVTGGNGTNTCIHIKWDGERDGEYEEYQEWSYPLDSNLELRGIPKLDANNKLYYDGDTYESDGTVKRKYAIVDFGTLTWTMTSLSGDRSAFTTPYSAWPATPNSSSGVLTDAINNILEKQVIQNASAWGSNVFLFTEAAGVLPQKSFAMIFDSSKYASVDAFVSDMVARSGQLVYAMKAQTTETAETYTNPQIVNDFGTEEYVDAGVTASTPTRDVAIPVGHQTFYQNNLRAKLEMAPDSPSGDGDYIVRQTDGENTYVPLVIPTELPTNPSTDGTYSLKVTIADGVAALSWVADS